MTPNPQGAPKKSSSNVLIIVLAVGGLAALCCVGTLAAIAVPNFIKFGGRAKQAEVRSNLKGAFVAQKAWFAEHDTYSESVEEVGFLPERGNRYLYLLAPRGDMLEQGGLDGGQHSQVGGDAKKVSPAPNNTVLRAGIPPPLLAEAGLHGTCPDECHITMLAVANLDGDSTLDLWSVSTRDRTIDGTPVPAGMPHKHVDDIDE